MKAYRLVGGPLVAVLGSMAWFLGALSGGGVLLGVVAAVPDARAVSPTFPLGSSEATTTGELTATSSTVTATSSTVPLTSSTVPLTSSTVPLTFPTVPVPRRLALRPDSGPPGAAVRATATGPRCHGEVRVGWAEQDPSTWIGAAPPATNSVVALTRPLTGPTEAAYGVVLTVPPSFGPGRHQVGAYCTRDRSAWPAAAFTVSPELRPALALAPETGRPGSEVMATASGHSCKGRVVIGWMEEEHSWTPAAFADGAYRATFTVPDDFAPQRHDVMARCQADGYTWSLASFSVVKVPGSTPWWPVLAVVGLVAGLALSAGRALRPRRDRRWVRAHLRVVPGDPARCEPETAGPRARPPSVDVVVRIEPHAGPGKQVIEEVSK